MFDFLPEEQKGKLWAHQIEAIDFAINHLNKNSFEKPCLIRMPTGTGKTGVIACLTRLSCKGSSLVLTPWANLRDQMVDDLVENFWKKIGINPNEIDIFPMLPTTAFEILQNKSKKIIIATFTTINILRLNLADIYKQLSDEISLVIVDEGHYEPAVEWGKSVKGLHKRTVLLTATPYRNDLKLFRISDPEHSTKHFTHEEATKKRIIRNVQITNLDSALDMKNLSEAFMKEWNEAKRSGNLPSKNPRAIICCSDKDAIEEVVLNLRKNKLEAIGIHEQFKNNGQDSYYFKDVPNPKTNDAEIWVHQHKLTEGLDDHRFCYLALFTKIRNDRKLIQQIGRILRRNEDDQDFPATILSPQEFTINYEWNAYLEFETKLELLNHNHYKEVVKNLLDQQPKVEYFEGRFRHRFNPDDLSQNSQIIISPSVLIREINSEFSLTKYVEDCTDTLNLEDAIILGGDGNQPCQQEDNFALWIYASIHNSRNLQRTSLYEIKLETHCVVVVNKFLFISDTCGHYPVEYLEQNSRYVPREILSLYIDESFQPTHVSVNNSIPYDNVMRGAVIRSHNLLNVPTSLTDRVQILHSLRGTSKKYGRRYLGMINGRVRDEISDEIRHNFDLPTFIKWAQEVNKIFESNLKCNALFNRYMPTCEPPSIIRPKTICIDLLRPDVSIEDLEKGLCILKGSSSMIREINDGTSLKLVCEFTFEGSDFDNLSTTLLIGYSPEKRRFIFRRESGANIRIFSDDNRTTLKSFAEYLNQNQDILLIGLEGGDIVYQGKNFYKIDYSYAERELLNLIRHQDIAKPIRTEKGSKDEIKTIKKIKSTTFLEGSLFQSVTNRLFDLPFEDELLICTDLGTECADFIAANFSDHKLALIHAKVGKGSQISASAFHDVVAQAMKNLVFLTRNANSPKGSSKWNQKSKWNKTNIPKFIRVPKNPPPYNTIWEKIKSDIICYSNPELYVVLLTSGCCDYEKLKEAILDEQKRTSEVAQLLHLLESLNLHSRQLGIRLIVYDLPFDVKKKEEQG